MNWRRVSQSVKTAAEISGDFTGYTDRPEVKLIGVPDLDRVRDALNVRWGLRLKTKDSGKAGITSKALKDNLWQDLSQNVNRGRGAASEGLGGTLCKGSCWYSYSADCVIDGQDCLTLQGWPLKLASDPFFSNSEKKEVAGEGYHMGCIGVVQTAFFLNPYAPWWTPQ
jgi:hypothetical protein